MASANCKEENWQTARESIRERNKFMFNNSLLSDVKFLPLATVEGKRTTIPAHKYVLAISSPVFFAMFYGDLVEKGDVVELPDCDSEGLLELLRYLYYDEVELTGSNVMQVLYLAKKYMVPSLAIKCSKFLESNLIPANVFSVLPCAMKLEEESLVKRCWHIIDEQGAEAVESESFMCIDKTLLSSVLERSTFKCPEVELFKAVMSWASRQCNRRGLGDSGAEKRKVIGKELLHLCRFPLMTQVEFVKNVLPADVLDKDEIVQMFYHFGGESTKGLCFSSAPRRESVLLRFERVNCKPPDALCWSYEGKEDSLTFSVDQPIHFLGVKLFGSENSTYKVDFSIYETQRSVKNLLYGLYASVRSKAEYYNGYSVMFDRPILLSASQEYTLRAVIQGSPSWYGENGTPSKTCDGVKFCFSDHCSPNGTSSARGQFPGIIFTKT